MAKRKSRKKPLTEKAYRERKKEVQKYSPFGFKLPSKGKLTPQQKGAITRKHNRLKHYISEVKKDTGNFVFVPTKSPKQARNLKQGFGTAATPKGVFVRIPSGTKRESGSRRGKVKIDKETGNLSREIGAIKETYVPVDQKKLAADPKLYLESLLAKLPPDTEQFQFSFEGHTLTKAYTRSSLLSIFIERYQSRIFNGINRGTYEGLKMTSLVALNIDPASDDTIRGMQKGQATAIPARDAKGRFAKRKKGTT